MIRVRGLTKRFGARAVLEEVDVHFRSGAVTALLGPNGAGKTTLLKCVLGLVRPSEGDVLVEGEPIDPDGSYRHGIGYMPQLPNFPPHMTGLELARMLDDLRDFRGRPDEELIEALDLRAELGEPFRTLSGGTRQKVNAALAFRYRAPILILDEPTAGLDPVASLALKAGVRACRTEGRTVVVTSHNLGDLQTIADHVVFLHEGRVRYDGSLGDLLATTRRSTLQEAIADLMRGSDATSRRETGRDTNEADPERRHLEVVR